MIRDGFDVFCSGILDRRVWPGRLSPDRLAREFVSHFGLGDFPTLGRLRDLVRDAGVGEVLATRLPKGLRGIHGGVRGGRYLIYCTEDDWDGGREHTAYHETYEILQEKFADQCPDYGPPGRPALCRKADRFAAAALMEPQIFQLFAESAGLDILALKQLYGKSYAAIALRLTEVMRCQPLLLAIYDIKDRDRWEPDRVPVGPESFAVSLVTRTPGFPAGRGGGAPRAFRCPARLIPRRKHGVIPGSAADLVIRSGRPVHVERILGYDLWGQADLTALARPVYWYGELAKVVVAAVPWRDRGVFEPQFANVSFERVSKAFQVI